jgi:glucose-6-phosphate 1-dehydrogenase
MQNHLLQILALVGMEQPLTLSAEHIRQEKVKLLQCVAPLELDHLLVGQFVAASGPGSSSKPGYLEDPTIANKGSTTETYAVAVLKINNPRWSGVPFVLKAGKALDQGKVEVRIR